MANSCDTVQSIRTGDGVTTQFSFTFTYDKESEVNVSLWDTTIKYYVPLATDQWSFVNATTIEFVTAPPAVVDEEGNTIANIKIWRQTDVDSLVASFYPGSAIRAQDLNNNFEQLRSAIQEGRCSIPDGVVVLLGDYWNRTIDTIRSSGTWESSDDKVATTAAINKQIEAIDSFPEAPEDSKLYGRKNAGWSEVPPPGISDAPIDNKEYVRVNGDWSEIPPDQSGVPEAPIGTGYTYGRKNATWVAISEAGGITYKGTRDLTLTAPTAVVGDFYVNTATSGVVDASWSGIGGTTLTGNERVIYDGTIWDILPMPEPTGVVEEIIAGNDITVNSADPTKPVVSVTPNSFIESVTAGLNITVTNGSTVGVTPASFIPYDISTLASLP